MLMYPEADIPVVAVSIVHNEQGYDPDFHFRLGQILGPVREDGVLILGSGFTYHNLGSFGGQESEINSKEFDQYLKDALTNDTYNQDARRELLNNWASAPKARKCHPEEDHLVPLFAIAGAGMYDPAMPNTAAKLVFDSNNVMGIQASGYMFE